MNARAGIAFLLSMQIMPAALAANGPWSLVEPQATIATLHSVTTNGTMDIAVGNSGAIVSSADGIHWNTVHTGYEALADNFVSVIWTGVEFIAIGQQGSILTSKDGIRWSAIYPQAGVQMVSQPGFTSIAYGNGIAVATSYGSEPAVSDKGSSWAVAFTGSLTNSNEYGYVGWNDGIFFADQNSPYAGLSSSTDGINWNPVANYPSKSACQIASNGTELLVMDNTGNIYSTTNGATWTNLGQAPTPFQTLNCNTLIPPVFEWTGKDYALMTGSLYYSSSDGTSWTSHTTPQNITLNSMIWDGSKYIAVGNSGFIAYSPDGNTWTQTNTGMTNEYIQSAVWDGSSYVLSLSNGNYTDHVLVGSGTSWQSVAIGVGNLFYVNGKIYGLGGINGVEISGDGLNWSALPASTNCTGLTTISGNGQSQLVGLEPGVNAISSCVSSDNGQTWSEQNTNVTNRVIALVFGNGEYVGITSSSIIISLDGVSWNQETVAAGAPTAIGYGNGLFIVAIGTSGTILTSSDGSNWLTNSIPPIQVQPTGSLVPIFNNIFWDGKEYLAVAQNNNTNPGMPYESTLWVSNDGAHWYPEILPPATVAYTIAVGTNAVLLGDAGAIAQSTPGAGDIPLASNVSVSLTPGQTISGQFSASDPQGQPLIYEFTYGNIETESLDGGVFNYLQVPSIGTFTVRALSVEQTGTTNYQYQVSNGTVYSAPANLSITVTNSTPPPPPGSPGGGGGQSSGGGGGFNLIVLVLLACFYMNRRKSTCHF